MSFDDRVADDSKLSSFYNVHLTLTRATMRLPGRCRLELRRPRRRHRMAWRRRRAGSPAFPRHDLRYVGLLACIEMAGLPDDLVLQ